VSGYINSLLYIYTVTVSTARIAVRRGEITQTPSNVATKVGQSVSLLCAGDHLMWENYSTSSSNPQVLALDTTMVGRCKDGQCSLNTDAGKYELTINSPFLSDGGKYRCKSQFGTAQYGDAEVIVFGKTYFQFYELLSHD